jgi:hypothetical protein
MDDTKLNQWAAEHRGLITHEQTLVNGLSDADVYRRTKSGLWIPEQPGVWRHAAAPHTWEQSLEAATYAVDGLVAASHRAGGQIWKLDGVPPDYVEISVTRADHARLRGGVVVHWSTDLIENHITLRNGILVTTPMRTLVDLGAVCRAHVVRLALHDALGRRLVTIDGVGAVMEQVARKGRRGVGVMRSLLEELGWTPAGYLEADAERFMRAYDLLQHFIAEYDIRNEAGLFLGRVDFAEPELKLALEFDGFKKFSSPQSVSAMFERQQSIEMEHWTFRRFTKWDVDMRPDYVAKVIRDTRAMLLATKSRA